MIIDTHAHLCFEEFAADLEVVLERARKESVSKILNVGCDVESSRRAVAMAKEYGGIYATIGLHPYESASFGSEVVEIWREILKGEDRKCVKAIGETGLDYYKCEVAKAAQIKSFEGHLALASEFGLPVIVHNREADEDCLISLAKFPDVKAVFHCFGSGLDFALRVIEAGHFVSFAATITYGNAEKILNVVRQIPLERFLVETDCPYLAPQVVRGRRNEPAFVVEVAKKIAEVRGLSFEEVARISTKNAENFFNI